MNKKTILISGISRGLGKALALSFAASGHKVIGCGRDSSRVRRLAEKLGKPHRVDVVDISSDQEVSAWSRDLRQAFAPPDLLINNAGVINSNAVLWEIPAEQFLDVMNTNVGGTANIIRHFLPVMIKRKRGIIVNLSSTWGRTVSANVAPYCASKWAVEGLTKALALELPRNMAAVALNPGIIDTDMLRSTFGEQAGAYPDPTEWAERAAPYLLGLSSKDNGLSLDVP